VCAVSEVLCSISGGHYTEFVNSSVSDEEKGRRGHATRVSNLRRRETHPRNGRLVSEEKGDMPTQLTSRISGTRISLLFNIHKKNVYKIFFKECSLCQHPTCPLAYIHERMCANGHSADPTQEAPRGAQVV
jgi:hypothetical protein